MFFATCNIFCNVERLNFKLGGFKMHENKPETDIHICNKVEPSSERAGSRLNSRPEIMLTLFQ